MQTRSSFKLCLFNVRFGYELALLHVYVSKDNLKEEKKNKIATNTSTNEMGSSVRSMLDLPLHQKEVGLQDKPLIINLTEYCTCL
jgi:hypothetical protein